MPYSSFIYFSEWVNEIFLQRDECSEFNLYQALLRQPERYFSYMRMYPADFMYIFTLVEPLIQKKHTHWRKPISAKERLCIALR